MSRLQIKQLSKQYANGVKALDAVSLTIPNGLFGLLGPNGAGKSSLMRTLATLQQPDAGSVWFDGVDIHQHPQQLRSQLGYLPQDFGVYPNVSASELLHHLAILKGLLNQSERREQVDALLQQTNLYSVRKQAVSTFSGGMQQRFGIAQALLGNPQLIIVDEPTAGLDPKERNHFHDLLSEIGEEVVVILSTHIVEDVYELCPQLAIMASGKIIAQGSPAQLMNSLQNRVWGKTIGNDTVPHYQTAHTVLSMRRFSGKRQVLVLADERPEAGFEPVSPSLEEVYFSVLLGTQPAGKGTLC